MCHNLEDLYKSVDQYFPTDKCHSITKSCAAKRSNQMQGRPMTSNVPEGEMFTGMASDYNLQLAFKKLPLVEFWGSTKGEYLPSPTAVIEKCLP